MNLRLGGFMVLLLLFTDISTASASTTGSREYQIKAVFLFNFTQFVVWPAESYPDIPGSTFVIGVLGDDPFGPLLDEAVSGETVNGRPVTVRRFRDPVGIETCQMVFVCRSESARLDQVLKTLEGRPVLTVSDGEGFAQRGVMIRLVTSAGKVRLKVNLATVQNARLQVSSKLLRAADIISTKGSGT